MKKILFIATIFFILTGFLTVAEAGNNFPKAYRYGTQDIVCLTFDDGYGRVSVEKIINVLHKKGVRCTFFVIGSQLKVFKDLWLKAISYGNEIAYHSMHHNYMASKSNAFILNDIDQWYKTAKEVLGEDYRIPNIIRLPGGSGFRSERIMNLLTGKGYIVVSWCLDTMTGVTAKSKRNTTSRICRYILRNVCSNSIILMHFDRYNANALPYYIDELLAKYTLGTLSEALDLVPPPTLTPEPPFNFDGHLAYATVENDVESLTVGATVTGRAAWKLYLDQKCTSEITDSTMVLSEGINRAYIQVVSENKRYKAVYPVLVYRLSGAQKPVIAAFDSGCREISDHSAVNSAVTVKLFGKPEHVTGVSKDGCEYSWNKTDNFSDEGNYTIDLTDGNCAAADTLRFTIDKTVSSITGSNISGRVANGGLSNKPVTVVVTDTNPGTKAAKKGNTNIGWPSGNAFSADGSFTITARDKAGNVSTYSFTIDQVPPVIAARCVTAMINGAYVKSAVTVSITDYTKILTTKNGSPCRWPSRSRFTSSGNYVITANDAAGNVSEFAFTIDTSKPGITAKMTSGKKVSSKGSANQSVIVTVCDTNLASNSATKDGSPIEWPADNTFTDEADYVIIASDKSGNTSTFIFRIDKAPVLTVTALNTGTPLLNNGSIPENVHIEVTDKYLKVKALALGGKLIPWPSDGNIYSDGVYRIYLKDGYGNKVSFVFTIIKAALSITAKSVGVDVLPDGGLTNKDVTVTVVGNNSALAATKDGNSCPYPSNHVFTEEGVYVISAHDVSGNEVIFTFTIDKTAPVIDIKDSSGNPVTENSSVSGAVTITVSEEDTKSLTKDGNPLTWADSLSEPGAYSITAEDAAGNKSALDFTICA